MVRYLGNLEDPMAIALKDELKKGDSIVLEISPNCLCLHGEIATRHWKTKQSTIMAMHQDILSILRLVTLHTQTSHLHHRHQSRQLCSQTPPSCQSGLKY